MGEVIFYDFVLGQSRSRKNRLWLRNFGPDEVDQSRSYVKLRYKLWSILVKIRSLDRSCYRELCFLHLKTKLYIQTLVNFGQFGQLRSTSVHFGQLRSTSVNFGQLGKIRLAQTLTLVLRNRSLTSTLANFVQQSLTKFTKFYEVKKLTF